MARGREDRWTRPGSESNSPNSCAQTAPADLADIVVARSPTPRATSPRSSAADRSPARSAPSSASTPTAMRRKSSISSPTAPSSSGLRKASVRALASEERDGVTPLSETASFSSPSIRSTAPQTSRSTSPSARCSPCSTRTPALRARLSCSQATSSAPPASSLYGPHTSFLFTTGVGDARGDARSGELALLRHQPAPADPRGAQRIRDQHVELAPLAGACQGLCRRPADGRGRPARARISTCAGSPRWPPTSIACCSAAASISIPTTRGPATARAACICSTKPIPWRC